VNDQTRIRLAIIEAKYGKRGARAASEAELARERASRFDEDFRRLRDEVLAPILEEIGAALTAAGHGHRVELDAGEHRPSVELHLLLEQARARDAESGSTGVIRLFTLTGEARGCEIIAEVQLKRTLVELTRFQDTAALTPEVVEQMVVDAVEQVFAYHGSS
jgi:hypothetical protein